MILTTSHSRKKLQKGVLSMTLDNLYIRATKAYIEMNDLRDKSEDVISDELLQLIKAFIKKENQTLPKAERFAYPKVLPPEAIKQLICAKYIIRRIHYYDSLDDDNFDIGFYDEKEGVYNTNPQALRKLIKSYNRSLKQTEYITMVEDLRADVEGVQREKAPHLVAVQNGIYNRHTHKLEPFHHEHVFLSKIQTDYNPNASDVDIEGWSVNGWFNSLSSNPEIVSLLWLIILVMLTPHISWNKAICLYSPIGNNGKGTFTKLCTNLIGAKNCFNVDFDSSSDFYLQGVEKAAAAICDECTSNIIKRVKDFKSLVTHDSLKVNRKGIKHIDIRPELSFLFCTNNLLKFNEKTEALYRRILYVPFEKEFEGCENKAIKNDYINRREVLEYVLKTVLELPEMESLPEPDVCKDVLELMKNNNDSVRLFFKEMLQKTVWKLLPYQFLYDLYRSWYRKNIPSGSPVGKHTFGVQCKQIFHNSNEYEWHETGIPTRNLMDEDEWLIDEYNLTGWMNNGYTGSDRQKKIDFCRLSSYTGLLKK